MKDLIILGNGMAGMTAALYASRANLDFTIIGRDEYDFGQIGHAVLVENFPCVKSQSGYDLALNLHNQLEENGIKISEHEVDEITRDFSEENYFTITCTDGAKYTSKSVIYALGARHRELKCETTGNVILHYCAICDGNFYKDKSVIVIGGGDSAFSQAEYLSNICSGVTILMCDSNITANSALVKRVKKKENIRIRKNFPVSSIFENEGHYTVCSAGIRGFYCAEGIFVAIGMIPNTEPISNSLWLHCLTSGNTGVLPVNHYTPAANYGLFFAGDILAKPLKQAITAAADGANAVQNVIEFLRRAENDKSN